MDLDASVTAPRVHLIATLFDERPEDGDRRRITQWAINPELRDGIANRKLVVPGQRYEMQPPGFAMAHHVKPGHRLVLRVTTSDPDKVPMFAVDPQGDGVHRHGRHERPPAGRRRPGAPAGRRAARGGRRDPDRGRPRPPSRAR